MKVNTNLILMPEFTLVTLPYELDCVSYHVQFLKELIISAVCLLVKSDECGSKPHVVIVNESNGGVDIMLERNGYKGSR